MIRLAKQCRHPLRLSVLMLLIAGASLAAQSKKPHAPPKKIVLVEITSKLGISLPPLSQAPDPGGLAPISADKFSLDYARQRLIPMMGGSIAVSDPDKGGRRYLCVVVPGGENHLFRQNLRSSFDDVTETTKVQEASSDLGAAFGDFNHSGQPSLFVAGLGGLRLYRNDGSGTFIDVTDRTGLRGKPGELATSVLLFDADGDGYLDVLETIYTDFSVPPRKNSFTFPNDFSGTNIRLYRNQHDGTFRDATEEAGLNSNPGRTRGAVAADFNHNGRMDLLLLRDNKPPVLYRNKGGGKFEDGTWDAGEEIWRYAYFSAQVTDFNHDGKPDLALWSTIAIQVLRNDGKGEFESEESRLPPVPLSNRPFGFHGAALDLEGGGYSSLLVRDSKQRWHWLGNDHGNFADVPVELRAENHGAEGKSENSAGLPAFAWMGAVRLRSSGVAQLLGLTMDGRVMVLERQGPGSVTQHGSPKRASE